jgi:hypothetical protein
MAGFSMTRRGFLGRVAALTGAVVTTHSAKHIPAPPSTNRGYVHVDRVEYYEAGRLLSRHDFMAPINMREGDALQTTWTVTFK